MNQPRQGYVVYYDTRRAAARRRLDKTLELLRGAGVHANGVVVEADPVSALRDAIDQLQPDEVIVSTHPQQTSGWLRRNAVNQMRRVAGDLPFQHVVVDLAAEHGEKNVLVVANQTVLGAPLLDKIRERAAKGPVSFLIISQVMELYFHCSCRREPRRARRHARSGRTAKICAREQSRDPAQLALCRSPRSGEPAR